MPKRRTPAAADRLDAAAEAAFVAAPSLGASRGRALLVAHDAAARASLRRVAEASGIACDFVSTFAQACDAMGSARYDAVVADNDLPDARGLDVLRRADADSRVALLCDNPDAATAIGALRLGAADILSKPINEPETLASLHACVQQSRAARARAMRTERLERVCRRLNAARRHMYAQVDAMCNDLTGAYQELADRVTQMSLASEFSAIIHQELDIEELLRKVLEYMLTKTGPTNAAIYLPSNHSDFSLGAYVNYNCPRDAADMLLEHLADVLPARFQDEARARVFANEAELAIAIDDETGWMEDSASLVLSCRHDDECLAVLVLFRDQSRGFSPEVIQQVETMGALFAAQLARVIRVHHRQLASDDEGWGLDDDAGLGGMAA